MDVLLLNAIIHFITFLFAIIKFRKVNLYVLIWLLYSFITFMGYYCVKENFHYSKDVNLGFKLDITPYIFAYITTVIFSYPFYKMDTSKINWKIEYPNTLTKLFNFVLFLFIIQVIYDGITVYIISQTIGFGEAYIRTHEGESINVFNNYFLIRVLHYIGVFTTALTPFYVVFFFTKIIKDESKFLLNIFKILLAFLPSILTSIAGGSKGALFFYAFQLIFYYVLFLPSLSKKICKKLNMIGIAVGSFFVVYVIIITASRIEAQHGSADYNQQKGEIIHYLGESYPNLGYFYYEKVRNHPNGKRFFPEFFSDNPEKNYKYDGLDAKFNYWEVKTGVPMAYFKTNWGDWYLEYGILGSFIAIFCVLLFFHKLWIKDYKKIYNIGIIIFYYNYIIIQGCFTGSGLEGSQKHNTLFIIILISIYFKHYYKNIQRDDFRKSVSNSNSRI